MKKRPSFSETSKLLQTGHPAADQVDSHSILNRFCQREEDPLIPPDNESLLSPLNDNRDFVSFDDTEDDFTSRDHETCEEKLSRKSPQMILRCNEMLNPFQMSKFEVYRDCSLMKDTATKNGNLSQMKGLKLRNSPELEISQNSVFNSKKDLPPLLSSSLELIPVKDYKDLTRSAEIRYDDSYFLLSNEARKTVIESINFSGIETMRYSSSSSSEVFDIIARKKLFYSEDHWKERKQIKSSGVSKSLPEKLPDDSRVLLFSKEEKDFPEIQENPEEHQELYGAEGITVSFQLGKSPLNFKEEEEIPILLTIKDDNNSLNYTKDVCIILGLDFLDVEQLELVFLEIGKHLNENDRLSLIVIDDEEVLTEMSLNDCQILRLVKNFVIFAKSQKRKNKNLNIFSCLFKTIEILNKRRYQSNFTSIVILTDTIYKVTIPNPIGHYAIEKFLMFLERRNLLNDSRFSIHAIGFGNKNFNMLGELCYYCRGEFYHVKNSSELIETLQLACHQAFSKKYFDISIVIEKTNTDDDVKIRIPNTCVQEIQRGKKFQVKIPNLIKGQEKHVVILAKIRSADRNDILSLFTVYTQAKRHENVITMKKRRSEIIFVDVNPFCVKVMRSDSNKLCSSMSIIVYLHYLRVILCEMLEKFTELYLREEFEVADGIFKENQEFNQMLKLLDANISQMGLYEKCFYDYLKKVLETVMRIGKSKKYSNLSSNYLLIMTHALFSEAPCLF